MVKQGLGDMRVRNFSRGLNASIARVQRRSRTFEQLWAEAGTDEADESIGGNALARKLALIELRSIDTELRDAMNWLKSLQEEIGRGA